MSSFADNKLVNATNVTTASTADKVWFNIGGSIRQMTMANFITTFASQFSSAAKRVQIRTVTANTSATSSDNLILVDTSGGDVAVNLDLASSMYSSVDTDTAQITVRQINHNSNTVTINPSGSDTINGASSYSLTSDSGATFVSDGTNIWTINT